MVNIGILKGLFDDKLVKIMTIFVNHPEKQYYLSEIARLSGVNATSTFRALNKLVAQEFIKANLIGRVRMYQLAKGEKANALSSLIKKDDGGPLDYFVERIKNTRVDRIFVDSRDLKSAKLILVGTLLSKNAEKVIEEVQNKYQYNIDFVEISEKQFRDMKKFNTFKDKKVLWKREFI